MYREAGNVSPLLFNSLLLPLASYFPLFCICSSTPIDLAIVCVCSNDVVLVAYLLALLRLGGLLAFTLRK